MQLETTFAALADPTRRAIVERLARGPALVGEIAEPFAISAPAISRHLRVLETAGLIESRRLGKARQCRIVPAELQHASDWFQQQAQFWTASFDRLGDFLKQGGGTQDDT